MCIRFDEPESHWQRRNPKSPYTHFLTYEQWSKYLPDEFKKQPVTFGDEEPAGESTET